MVDARTLASMIENAMERNPQRVASDEAIVAFVRTMRRDAGEDLQQSA